MKVYIALLKIDPPNIKNRTGHLHDKKSPFHGSVEQFSSGNNFRNERFAKIGDIKISKMVFRQLRGLREGSLPGYRPRSRVWSGGNLPDYRTQLNSSETLAKAKI